MSSWFNDVVILDCNITLDLWSWALCRIYDCVKTAKSFTYLYLEDSGDDAVESADPINSAELKTDLFQLLLDYEWAQKVSCGVIKHVVLSTDTFKMGMKNSYWCVGNLLIMGNILWILQAGAVYTDVHA